LSSHARLEAFVIQTKLTKLKFCEDTRPDPQLQKAKTQHSILIANLNRLGYGEVKLHVILEGAMGTIYKDYRQTSGRPRSGLP
jgi:hypothetical protein